MSNPISNLSKLDFLKTQDLNCNIFSVYDYDDFSIQELLCTFFEKINQCVDVSNATFKLAEWLVSVGLSQEVAKKLEFWLTDGTLADIINQTIFNELNNKIDILNKAKLITVDMFGAIGDGVTDDFESIQKAINYGIENNITIYFNEKRYYTTKSIMVNNCKLRGISNSPGDCDVLYLQRKDGTYLNDSPDWGYIFNTNTKFTWRDIINELSWGCCIISDKDIDILKCDEKSSYDIEGICIIGNHNCKNQNGISDTIPLKYVGNKHNFKNITVVGCGKNGINLFRGFEVSTIENVKCECNMGHGLFVGHNDNIDSATEYLYFNNCRFSNNRLNGVFFSFWRKDINFNNCYLNGNGQYYVNSIDPILGYDRRLPNSIEDCKSGIWFDKGNIDNNNISMTLNISNCYGEETIKGVHISNTIGNGVVNNVIFENNIFYKGSIQSSFNGSCLYVDINYGVNWYVMGNFGNALETIIFKREPNSDGNMFIYDDNTKPFSFNNEIKTSKRLYGEQVLIRDYNGVTTDCVKNDFIKKTVNDKSNLTALYIISSHSQTNIIDSFGVYLGVVTKLPSKKYQMCLLPSSNITGFTSQPSINDDGVITLNLSEYHRCTITRVDNQLTNIL